ncbi:MAG: DUF6776 family protein [Pseudomonadales bacterium]
MNPLKATQDRDGSKTASARPWRSRYIEIFVAVLLLLACIAGVYLGSVFGADYGAERMRFLNELELQYQTLQQQLSVKEDELAVIQVGANIDRQSAEQVRQLLVEKDKELATLRQDLAFYRSMMTPTETERGLIVGDMTLWPASVPYRYRYRFSMKQLALKHRLISVRLTMSIGGHTQHEAATIPLGEVKTIKFRYYQNMEGEFTLPEGFGPERVFIHAEVIKGDKQLLEREMTWEQAFDE